MSVQVQCVYCNAWFDSLLRRCPNPACELNSAPSAAGRRLTPSSNEGGLPATVGAVPKVYVLTCDYSQDTRTIAGVYAHQGMAEATQKMHEATRQCWADDHTIEEHEIVE